MLQLYKRIMLVFVLVAGLGSCAQFDGRLGMMGKDKEELSTQHATTNSNEEDADEARTLEAYERQYESFSQEAEELKQLSSHTLSVASGLKLQTAHIKALKEMIGKMDVDIVLYDDYINRIGELIDGGLKGVLDELGTSDEKYAKYDELRERFLKQNNEVLDAKLDTKFAKCSLKDKMIRQYLAKKQEQEQKKAERRLQFQKKKSAPVVVMKDGLPSIEEEGE